MPFGNAKEFRIYKCTKIALTIYLRSGREQNSPRYFTYSWAITMTAESWCDGIGRCSTWVVCIAYHKRFCFDDAALALCRRSWCTMLPASDSINRPHNLHIAAYVPVFILLTIWHRPNIGEVYYAIAAFYSNGNTVVIMYYVCGVPECGWNVPTPTSIDSIRS